MTTVLTDGALRCGVAAHEDNPQAFLEDVLRVPAGAGGSARIRLNKAQRVVLAEMERQRKAGLPVRVIVLKPRVVGITTLVLGYMAWTMCNRRNCRAMSVGHNFDAAGAIYRALEGMFKNMSSEHAPEVEPYGDRCGLLLPELKNTYTATTAEYRDVGRAVSVQFLHASEVAFWPHRGAMDSLRDAVPYEPGTVFIAESSGNGKDDVFYPAWQRAVAGLSVFRPIFIPWWLLDEHCLPITEDEARAWEEFRSALDAVGPSERRRLRWNDSVLRLDEEEIELARLFPVEFGHIKWRRWVIANRYGGDVRLFKRDYPSSPEEAFAIW